MAAAAAGEFVRVGELAAPRGISSRFGWAQFKRAPILRPAKVARQ